MRFGRAKYSFPRKVFTMEQIYRETFLLKSTDCDRFGRLKPSVLLSLMQEVASEQCRDTEVSWDALAQKGLFFAISRTHVRINRLPGARERITLETWPGKTSRVAYPRHTVAYDASGNELFRAVSLWVLMDVNSRAMVIPGKSGVNFDGWEFGGELPVPSSIAPKELALNTERTVAFSELDVNGHMNNTHCADWAQDLLPSAYHADHPLQDFTVCYLSEAREGDRIRVCYELSNEGALVVNSLLTDETPAGNKERRVFAIRANYL